MSSSEPVRRARADRGVVLGQGRNQCAKARSRLRPVRLPERPATCAAPLLLLLTCAVAASAAGQQHPAHDHGRIGTVDYRVSCSAGVQADFNEAVGLLHHMMYSESRAAFERIAEREPGCAMAHWGVAVTLFQPLWPARPTVEIRQRGRELVERAKLLGPTSERERALLAAAEAFYEDPEAEEWWPRIRRWADVLREAYREHPEDVEIATFHALGEIAVGQIEPDQLAFNARAARVLLRMHERHPDHPGVLHYTIHANDASGRQGESLEIVRSYDGIAPNVPHALHMPTHIFVRLGEWLEVIEWNRRSADAALRFPVGDRTSLHHAHALDYLVYAHLQRGEDEAARAALAEALAAGSYQEDFASAFHLAAMPARIAVEGRAWEEAAAIEPLRPDYLQWSRYPWAESLSWFARGLGAAYTGHLERAREAESRMGSLRDGARAAGEEGFATYIEVDRLILAAWIAHARRDSTSALAALREAAALEQTVQKHAITPGAMFPPYEALGDLLLQLERPAEALEAYEASLGIWPLRYHSMLGAARAARAAGMTERARELYEGLVDLTEGARTSRGAPAEARDYLAGR